MQSPLKKTTKFNYFVHGIRHDIQESSTIEKNLRQSNINKYSSEK